MAIKNFVNTVSWTFAKSMPEIPHEYIVTDNYPGKSKEINAFIAEIEKNGYTKSFYGKEYKYLEINGYKYWVMPCPYVASPAGKSEGGGNIINRTRNSQSSG